MNTPSSTPLKREHDALKHPVQVMLRQKPLHGRGIINAIEENYEYPPSLGIVYPMLQISRTRDRGNDVARAKKVRTLTAEARLHLDRHRDAVELD